MTKLVDIEGIGEVYAEKLNVIGLATIEQFLEKCCEKKGRVEVANASGISEKLLLAWTNRADLARVKGISTQYADLLECGGVDTVPELAQRNAENLHAKLEEVNQAKNLVRKLPTLSNVESWILQAKELPRVVNH